MTRWTKEEIYILKDNYQTNLKKEIRHLLPNRTWSAIQIKAQKLNLCLTSEQRFWKSVDKKSNDKCWNWTGHCNNAGYGRISINNKDIKAHRFSWELHNNKIPKNKPCVLHHCDNPTCVNPEHLFLGTYQDNTNDMIDKGRNNKSKGEKHRMAKLTSGKVKKIRMLCNQKKLTQIQISKIFNVSQATISYIYNNKIWRRI